MTEAIEGDFPEHPLLDVRELGEFGELPDLRDEVPHLLSYLNPLEKIVKIEPVDKATMARPPSALREMMRLTGVEHTREIGTKGPSLASLSFEVNAGLPELTKFENVFGRDSLLTAWLLKDLYPQLQEATVLRLAELQGVDFDPQTGEEPGGIMHDNLDPSTPVAKKFMALLGWRYPFYGTVDATPLFIAAFKDCAERAPDFMQRTYVNKRGETLPLLEAFNLAVDWLTRRLDANPDGLLEYHKTEAKGLDNQAWKDSFHAYMHKDGSPANHEAGIASIEVQGYAYDALLAAAELREQLGREAGGLRERAAKLQRKVLSEFWVEDDKGGYFALATDRDEHGNLRQLQVRTSNMGHLLNSQILDGGEPEIIEKREAVIQNLFRPDMLSAGGVRTMASSEVAFNPYSYHNGGVWPHDNGIVAMGLERHGYYGLAWEINKRILACANVTHSFPEVVQGGDEDEPRISKLWAYAYDPSIALLYPVERTPQEIQAWTTAAALRAKAKAPVPAGFGRKLPEMPPVATDVLKRLFEVELIGLAA